MKLDFRFADEDDSADLEIFVNAAHLLESQSDSPFMFRNEGSRVSMQQVCLCDLSILDINDCR